MTTRPPGASAAPTALEVRERLGRVLERVLEDGEVVRPGLEGDRVERALPGVDAARDRRRRTRRPTARRRSSASPVDEPARQVAAPAADVEPAPRRARRDGGQREAAPRQPRSARADRPRDRGRREAVGFRVRARTPPDRTAASSAGGHPRLRRAAAARRADGDGRRAVPAVQAVAAGEALAGRRRRRRRRIRRWQGRAGIEKSGESRLPPVLHVLHLLPHRGGGAETYIDLLEGDAGRRAPAASRCPRRRAGRTRCGRSRGRVPAARRARRGRRTSCTRTATRRRCSPCPCGRA